MEEKNKLKKLVILLLLFMVIVIVSFLIEKILIFRADGKFYPSQAERIKDAPKEEPGAIPTVLPKNEILSPYPSPTGLQEQI